MTLPKRYGKIGTQYLCLNVSKLIRGHSQCTGGIRLTGYCTRGTCLYCTPELPKVRCFVLKKDRILLNTVFCFGTFTPLEAWTAFTA